MLTKAITMSALCLLLAACGGAPMGAWSGGEGSGSSAGGLTSYETGYGVVGSGASDDTRDGQMDWSE